MGNNQIAMGNNQIANGISPSPSGEVRWGLDVDMLSNNNFYIKTKTNIRSNLFLPFGKVRMGLRLGGGWMAVCGVIIIVSPRLRITNRKRLPVQPVYLGLSLVFFCEVVTRSPPIPVIQVDCRELALVRATCVAGIKP